MHRTCNALRLRKFCSYTEFSTNTLAPKSRVVAFACLLLTMILPPGIFSQIPTRIVNEQEKYYRNSISILLLELPEDNKYRTFVEREIDNSVIPPKFFDNRIFPRTVPFDKSLRKISDSTDLKGLQQRIRNQLIKEKYGKNVLNSWFDRQEDGFFNLNTFCQRSLYSASDRDILLANASLRGERYLFDLATKLIDRNYILVFHFEDIKTKEEKYAVSQTLYANRDAKGFEGKVYGFLFKIEFPRTLQEDFFRKCWIDASTNKDSIDIRKKEYENFNPDIKCDTILCVATAGLDKSKDGHNGDASSSSKLFQYFVNNAVQGIIDQIEVTKREFQVTTPIVETNPIQMKIGTKEDLLFDQRYFVYEDEKVGSEVKPRLVGVVRAYEIANNLSREAGQTLPSKFYQTYGSKIDNFGMYGVQKNGGGNFYGGAVMVGGLKNLLLRAEIGLSNKRKPIHESESGYLPYAKIKKSLRIYMEFALDFDSNTGTWVGLSGGLIKDFFLTRNVFLSPHLGFSWESSWEYNAATFEIDAGTDFGISIGPARRIYSAFRIYLPPWLDYREDFIPIGIGIGIQQEF